MAAGADLVREKVLTDYRKKLLEHKELEARLKESKLIYNLSKLSFMDVFFNKSDYEMLKPAIVQNCIVTKASLTVFSSVLAVHCALS